MNESETDWLHFSQNAYLKHTLILTLCPKEHLSLPRGEGPQPHVLEDCEARVLSHPARLPGRFPLLSACHSS